MQRPLPTWADGSRCSAAAIEISELVMAFAGDTGPVLALDQVSLAIRRGEFVSLVGPSGCGKTTVLNLVAGLIPAWTRGGIRVLGQLPTAGNRDIAYMLARDCLLPWRTTLANAAFGMELRGLSRSERERRAQELLTRVGLKDFSGSYPKSLSQGMRQRCALARTFALDTPVLLMDEPFGALDAQTKLQLEDVLMALWSSTEKSVIFVTHDLAEAVALSDRVVVLSARPGRIVADVAIDLPRPRNVRALQTQPRFHSLYAELWAQLERGMAHATHTV